MKKLSIKEKAKAYDKAIERAVNIRTGKCETTFIFTEGLFDYLFPELEECNEEEVREAMIDFFKHEREEGVVVSHYGVNIERMIAWLEKQGQVNETIISQHENKICKENNDSLTSEDARIKKYLLSMFSDPNDSWDGISAREIIAWLEKQGNIDKASYEIAEKEKYDFVSGQFIECRKSFNAFKEDNSYWFEYVGNDTYIGRSDNILNKKFHITPRQLYRLFTQQHSPKENNVVNEGTNVPTAYGKYVDECLNEAAKHFFSEGEDKYSVADLFYAGVRCGQSWLENKGETFTKKDVDDAWLKGMCDAKHELEKQGGQNPAWSEEDENSLSTIIAEFSKCAGKSVSKDEWMRCNDFLNSLKERVLLQPKQKWSEEDALRLEEVICMIEANGRWVRSDDAVKSVLDWLKSLQQRIGE